MTPRAKIRIAGELLTQHGEPTTYSLPVRVAAAIRCLSREDGKIDRALSAYQRRQNPTIIETRK